MHLLLLQSGNRLLLFDFFSQGWRAAFWDRKMLRLLLLSLALGRLALTGLLFDALAAEEVRVSRAVEVNADAARS